MTTATPGITVERATTKEMSTVFEIAARHGVCVAYGRIVGSQLHLELSADSDAELMVRELTRLGMSVRLGAKMLASSITDLSQREQEMLFWFAKGLQVKGTAKAMGISTSTVREHWLRTKRKLGVVTVGQAVSYWTGHLIRESEATLRQMTNGPDEDLKPWTPTPTPPLVNVR